MHLFFKLGVAVAMVVAVGAGLAPPLFARGELDGYARDAAQKGSAVVLNEGDAAAVQLATEAGSQHSGVHVDNVTVDGNNVYVTLSETVRTFLRSFHVTVTQGSSLGD